MKRKKQAEAALVEACSATPSKLTKKELLKEAQAACAGGSSITEAHFRKAFRKLKKRGVLIKLENNGCYLVKTIPKENNDQSSLDETSIVSSSKTVLPFAELLRRRSTENSQKASQAAQQLLLDKAPQNKEETIVPFAESLRRRAASAKCIPTNVGGTKQKEENLEDTDEEIRRLEAELANSDDSDYDSEDESNTDNEEHNIGNVSKKKKISFGETTTVNISSREETPLLPAKDPNEPDILCLSSTAADRITPLPSSCLPKSKKRSLKGIDDNGTGSDKASKKREKEKVVVSEGLQQAVKEVLSGYVARSSERLPFYCRVCAVQFKNEPEFLEHKQTEFHKTAVNMERKASFCKLCRKQFTSPVQLKDHVFSKPHRERLHNVQSRQHQRRPNGPQFVGAREQESTARGQSSRQWC